MHGLPIDDGSVDRLLSGVVSPEDAPPGYAGVAEVLRSAGGPTVAAERWREQEIVTRAARCIAETTDPHEMRGRSMRSSLLPFKVIAASAVGVLGLAGAAAAIGVNLASHHTRLDSGTSVVTPTTGSTVQPDATGGGTSPPATSSNGVGPVTGMTKGHATFGLCTAFLAATKGTGTTASGTTGMLGSTAFRTLIAAHGGTVATTTTFCTTYVATNKPGAATHPGPTTHPGKATHPGTGTTPSSAASTHPGGSTHPTTPAHPTTSANPAGPVSHPTASTHPTAPAHAGP